MLHWARKRAWGQRFELQAVRSAPESGLGFKDWLTWHFSGVLT